MGDIKAITTYYDGYPFRSRLEARWAVFFNEMDIEYEYEPEGFILSDGTYYLPDFYLPGFHVFFEVKAKHLHYCIMVCYQILNIHLVLIHI